MNLKLTSLFQMLTRLSNFATSPDNNPITITVEVFNNGILFIQKTLPVISSLNQVVSIKGIAADKKALKKTLSNTTVSIMKRVKSYSVFIGDNELKAACVTALSSLMKLKASDLVTYCTDMNATVTPLIADMQAAGYNIIALELVDWTDETDAFNAVITAPQQRIKNRKTINAQIKSLIKDCMDTCYNTLDLNIVSFSSSPQYMAEYYNQRQVIDTNILHTNLQCMCMIQDTETFVYPVEITVLSTIPKTITNKIDGTGRVEKVEPGNWKVKAVWNGQTLISDYIHFEKGHTVVNTFAFDAQFQLPAKVDKKVKVKI